MVEPSLDLAQIYEIGFKDWINTFLTTNLNIALKSLRLKMYYQMILVLRIKKNKYRVELRRKEYKTTINCVVLFPYLQVNYTLLC